MAAIVSQIVEVCVFRGSKPEPQYLLLKRSEHDKLYPGTWQIVTGVMEQGEHSVQAALRELKEETGLSIRRLWTVPVVSSFYDPSKDFIHLIPMFAVEVSTGQEPVLSSEHQTSAWFSYENARKKLVWPDQRKTLKVVHKYIVGDQEAARLTAVTLP